jgi:hypothetical protein
MMPKKKIRRIVDFFDFLWARRLWWLIPMVTFLVLVGVLMLFTHSAATAPFIYPLF